MNVTVLISPLHYLTIMKRNKNLIDTSSKDARQLYYFRPTTLKRMSNSSHLSSNQSTSVLTSKHIPSLDHMSYQNVSKSLKLIKHASTNHNTTMEQGEDLYESFDDAIYSQNYVLKTRINEIVKDNLMLKGKLGYEKSQLQQYEQYLINNGFLEEAESRVSAKVTTIQERPEHLLMKRSLRELISKKEQIDSQYSSLKSGLKEGSQVVQAMYEASYSNFIEDLWTLKFKNMKSTMGTYAASLALLRINQEQRQRTDEIRLCNSVDMQALEVIKELHRKMVKTIKAFREKYENLTQQRETVFQRYNELSYNEEQQTRKFQQIFFMNKHRRTLKSLNSSTINTLYEEQTKIIAQQEKQIAHYQLANQQQNYFLIHERQELLKQKIQLQGTVTKLREAIDSFNDKIFIGAKVLDHQISSDMTNHQNTTVDVSEI